MGSASMFFCFALHCCWCCYYIAVDVLLNAIRHSMSFTIQYLVIKVQLIEVEWRRVVQRNEKMIA